MVAREIGETFHRSGFEKLVGAYPEVVYWCTKTEGVMFCCGVYDFAKGHHLTKEELEADFEYIKQRLFDSGVEAVGMLSIVCTYDCREARKYTIDKGACWFVDINELRLIIYEDQKVADVALKGVIEKVLDRIRENRQDKGTNILNRAPATILLALINVIVFIIMELIGSTTDAYFMYKHGAMYMPAITEGGEYYRLFTAMFLHFGIEHLAGNVIALIFIGDIVENALGKVKYVLLYILSGIFASACSVLMNIFTDSFVVSAGASGAIFGIMGALVYIVWVNKGHFGSLSRSRLIFAVLYTLFTGFTSSGVDNAAHVGGLIAGFILGTSFYRRKSITKESSL